MQDSEPQELSLREGLQPFKNQSHVLHAIMVIGGVFVWIGAYVAVMNVTGWDALAAEESIRAMHARRNAGGVASGVCGLYFGVMWTRAYGGPLLNFFYPMIIISFMPDGVLALFQTPPEHVITMGTSFLDARFAWDYVVFGIPFMLMSIPIFYKHKHMTEEEKREWRDKHAPEVWYEGRKE